MKFKNKLLEGKNQYALKKALVNWELNTDGMDYATGEVLAQIPWEYNECDVWEKWYDKIDQAIGGHKSWDTGAMVFDENYREMFIGYIEKKFDDILKVYTMAIEDLNKKYEKCMVVEQFVGTDARGFCKYEIVGRIYGDSFYDCICKIWESYHLKNSDWTFQQFVDACYNGNVHMKNELHCHFGCELTNSNV